MRDGCNRFCIRGGGVDAGGVVGRTLLFIDCVIRATTVAAQTAFKAGRCYTLDGSAFAFVQVDIYEIGRAHV